MAAKCIVVLVLLKWASANDIPRIKIINDQNVGNISDQGDNGAIVYDISKRTTLCEDHEGACVSKTKCEKHNINTKFTCPIPRDVCCIKGIFEGPYQNIWGAGPCPSLGRVLTKKTLGQCKTLCLKHRRCNAINYDHSSAAICSLRACGDSVPAPLVYTQGYQGYSLGQGVAPVVFMIIHKISGSHLTGCAPAWVCIYSPGADSVWNHWTFESMDNEWGLIRNLANGNIFYPDFVNDPTSNSLSLEAFKNDGTIGYFAIDQVLSKIVQRYGTIVEPQPASDPALPIPGTGGVVLLTADTDEEYAKFAFVNPYDQSQEVLPYGHPFIYGEWRLAFSLVNALATQTWEHTVTVGKSVTESSNYEFKFGFEYEASAKDSFMGGSMSVTEKLSLTLSIQHSDSSTWSKETTATRTITVEEGESVAVWQLVFSAYQHGHTAVHASNIFQDTSSPYTMPPEP